MAALMREIHVLGTPKVNLLSHIKPEDSFWKSGGLRDFFLCL